MRTFSASEWTTRLLAAVLLGVVALLIGCKKGVSAKEPSAVITRWKSEPVGRGLEGSTFGLVIEQQGEKVSGRMYELKGREGFEILETYPEGRYNPRTRELTIPIGRIPGGTLDDYLNAGLPYLQFEVVLSRDRLVGRYYLPGSEPSLYAFVRYLPPVASAR